MRFFRGTAVLALLLVFIFIQEGHKTAESFTENGSVWRFFPVHYCINPSDSPNDHDGQRVITDEEFIALVQASFQKWVDAPGSDLSFAYDGVCKNTPGRRDKVNTIGWRNLGRIPAIGAEVANESDGKYLRGGASYERTEADIALNNRVDFYDDLSFYKSDILPSTILHEIGHFIGLGHSEEKPCTVMTSKDVYPTELCQDDIDGAARLYP